jgi:hypothetical protein
MRREASGAPSIVKRASHRYATTTRRPYGPPLTPEPLRPLRPAIAGRPGACPVPRAPHPDTASSHGQAGLVGVVKVRVTYAPGGVPLAHGRRGTLVAAERPCHAVRRRMIVPSHRNGRRRARRVLDALVDRGKQQCLPPLFCGGAPMSVAPDRTERDDLDNFPDWRYDNRGAQAAIEEACRLD